MIKKNLHSISEFFPEVNISNYTSIDGTIEFYGRINSILKSSMTVLDLGAGRGAWFNDDTCEHRRKTRILKNKVKKVIGCDVDDVVLKNNALDEAFVIKNNEKLPFDDSSFDIIICDFVLEHISEPENFSEEIHRVLRKDGWLCARTPNKYSLISFFTRAFKNDYHAKILKRVQPDRKEIDIFPTKFKLNTLKEVALYFPADKFLNFTYRYEPEPSYYFGNKYIFIVILILNKISPPIFKSNLFLFLKKK